MRLVRPAELARARNTGSATTNQMSRDPNRKNRAADSRLIAVDFDRIERSGGFFFDSPMSSSSSTSSATTVTASIAGHRPQRLVVAEPRQQRGAEEEADALQCVLRTGEDRHQPEQRAVTVAGDGLDRALRAHLGEVLGDAATAPAPPSRTRPTPTRAQLGCVERERDAARRSAGRGRRRACG